ncbi:MAG: methyltransferase domain-containing protein [Candidatus Aenigmatarchaeota archaeon]
MSNKGSWEHEWAGFKGLNIFGKIFARSQRNTVKRFLEGENVPKTAKILDFGCGSGRTLSMFRESGYGNSIGLDVSPSSIKLCEKRGFKAGKDVFLYKGNRAPFRGKTFDLVFADGVLEHFKNFAPIAREMCRLSKRYAVITQPNHFSLYGKLLRISGRKAVYEYTYNTADFVKAFEKSGFHLIRFARFNFGEHWAFLFAKR